MQSEAESGTKYAGFKQSKRAITDGKAVKAFLAMDCPPDMRSTIESLCRQHNVEMEYVPSMKPLGVKCGLEVGCSVAGIAEQ